MDDQERFSRIGPLSGAIGVALEFAGVAIGSQPMVTLGDSKTKILDAITKHVGTGAWVGAYLELLSLAAFAVFAGWLLRSRRGPLATAGVIAAGSYVAVTLVALVVGDIVKYGSGHGMGHAELLALFDLQSGLYFSTWGIAAAFLALVPVSGWLRRSALAIAGLQLVALAAPTASAAQFPGMLFMIWIVVTSVALARRPRAAASGAAAVAHA